MLNVIQLLRKRGLVEASTPDIELCAEQPLKVYCGFDPTADSLHLGNLLGIVVLAWFQRCGHQPVAVVGGATGMIGDPGGKVSERPLLALDTLRSNTEAIHKQLDLLLNRDKTQAAPLPIYNNFDWFGGFGFLEFLRDVGKHFRLGPMLAKEMVRTRLQSEEGMSFTEFSYQLLQSYDFLHLLRSEGVRMQIGGSDQWGNITAGIELIRKVAAQPAFGLVFPLLTRSDGQKFGKSEKGAIWLSAERLSPYDFYQHLYRISDVDAIKLLRMLTFLPLEMVEDYAKQLHEGRCPSNAVQKLLAEEVTRFVHGAEGLTSALTVTASLAPGKETNLDAASLLALGTQVPTLQWKRQQISDVSLIDCLVATQLCASKSEARKILLNGGIYLNNKKVCDVKYMLTPSDLIEDRFLLLAAGKKNKIVVQVT